MIMASVTSIYDRNFGKHGSAKRSTFFWVAHSYNIGIALTTRAVSATVSPLVALDCSAPEKPSVCPPRLSMAIQKKAGFSYWVHKIRSPAFCRQPHAHTSPERRQFDQPNPGLPRFIVIEIRLVHQVSHSHSPFIRYSSRFAPTEINWIS